MAIAELVAAARPEGNRIDVSWENPDLATLPGIRIVRREGAFPATPTPGLDVEGEVVADTDAGVAAPSPIVQDGTGFRIADLGLRAETVYYYRVFPYSGSPAQYELAPVHHASAMATGPYRFAELMSELLPAIYHRYDTVRPDDVPALDPAVVAAMSPEDQQRGQLARFLQIVGGLFDQHYSSVRSMRQLYDPTRVDGRLLPLLAEWIGWRSDFHLGYDGQRREIADAPAIYRAVENVATVEATVRRISGWETRSKEFVDNVAASNRPERLNLWLATDGGPSFDVDRLSLDHANSGRPATATVGGATRLVYHTLKGGRWDIWQKTHDGADWVGSQPVVSRAGTSDTDPAVAVQATTAWLFWTVFDHDTGRWRIDMRTESGGDHTPITSFATGPGDDVERRGVVSAVDGDGGLWLFWYERIDGEWVLRHDRFTSDPWDPTPTTAVDVPDAPDMRVDADLHVVTRLPRPGDPIDPFRRVGLLWARQTPMTPQGQSRWRVVARFKDGVDPADTTDWTAIEQLPTADVLDHDREPSAVVDDDGDLDVVWSSTRDGSWSVVRATFDVTALAWGAASSVTGAPFSDRGPVHVDVGEATAIVFRSNRSVTYTSETYRGTDTVDRRYSGTTTVFTPNATKIGLRTEFDDFSTYTYDAGPTAGRTDDDWYARDTLGLYLEPDTFDPDATAATRARLRRVLPEFVPLTDRTVFVDTAPELHVDHFYAYGDIDADAPPSVGESHGEDIVAVAGDAIVDDGDFVDALET